jgi:hypothetical protein
MRLHGISKSCGAFPYARSSDISTKGFDYGPKSTQKVERVEKWKKERKILRGRTAAGHWMRFLIYFAERKLLVMPMHEPVGEEWRS